MADTEKIVDINQQLRLDKNLIKEDCYNILRTEDPKAQYICGTKGFEEDVETEFTHISKVDYSIGAQDDKDNLEEDQPETRKNLSFLTVKTVEEGVEWYREYDPKIPEDLLPVMARWSFGDLSSITKKQIKNEKKKEKKKKKKDDKRGITVRHSTKENPIILSFD